MKLVKLSKPDAIIILASKFFCVQITQGESSGMSVEFLAVHIHSLTQLNQKQQQSAAKKGTTLKDWKHNMSHKTVNFTHKPKTTEERRQTATRSRRVFFPHSVRENQNTNNHHNGECSKSLQAKFKCFL